MSKVHNFSAGPSILPQEVFKQASAAVLDYNSTGLSLLEMSHRSKEFVAIMDEAQSLVKELLHVPDGYHVLFLTGGASSQFFMTNLNLLPQDGKACYLDTGTWSTKAIKEARRYGEIDIVASSGDKNYNYIPKEYTIDPSARFLHITTNNTIYGTQLSEIPESPAPLVADMSSDIFSRPINVEDYDLIYAGAQKNMGPAGVTLVIVRESALGKVDRDIPTMLDYRTHINKGSMFNTPPTFPIYTSMLVMRWVKEMGGCSAMEKRNKEKAKLFYNEVDRNPLFKGLVATEDRSKMNPTFALQDERYTETFNELCSEANISGLKGHRSVGGYRASMYNALELSSVEILVNCMKELERSHG